MAEGRSVKEGAPAPPVRLEFVEMSDAAAPVTPRDGLVGRLEQAALSADSGYAIDAELLTEAAKCIADLEPDAERYAWIKSRQHADIAAAWLLPLAIPCASVDDLDNAIDCARSIDAAPVTPATAIAQTGPPGCSHRWASTPAHRSVCTECGAEMTWTEEGEPKGDTQ